MVSYLYAPTLWPRFASQGSRTPLESAHSVLLKKYDEIKSAGLTAIQALSTQPKTGATQDTSIQSAGLFAILSKQPNDISQKLRTAVNSAVLKAELPFITSNHFEQSAVQGFVSEGPLHMTLVTLRKAQANNDPVTLPEAESIQRALQSRTKISLTFYDLIMTPSLDIIAVFLHSPSVKKVRADAMALNRRYESPSIYHVTVARLAPTWTVNNPKALRTLHKELARQTLLLKKELEPIRLNTVS